MTLLKDEADWRFMFTLFERSMKIKSPWLDRIHAADVGTPYFFSIRCQYLHTVELYVIKCALIEYFNLSSLSLQSLAHILRVDIVDPTEEMVRLSISSCYDWEIPGKRTF